MARTALVQKRAQNQKEKKEDPKAKPVSDKDKFPGQGQRLGGGASEAGTSKASSSTSPAAEKSSDANKSPKEGKDKLSKNMKNSTKKIPKEGVRRSTRGTGEDSSSQKTKKHSSGFDLPEGIRLSGGVKSLLKGLGM